MDGPDLHYIFSGATSSVIFARLEDFLALHSAFAVRVRDGFTTEFLVYNEDGALVWVGEDELEPQTTAMIASIPRNS